MGFIESKDYRYAFKNSDDKYGIISIEELEEINNLIINTGYSLALVDIGTLMIPNDLNIEVIHAEVLFDNMNNEEKAQKICSEINKLVENCECRKELIIIDRYLFFKDAKPDYIKLLADILKTSGFENVIVITSKSVKKFDDKVYEEIEKQLNGVCSLKVVLTGKIHDRFWIANRKKALVMGTSLNGLGARLCYIDIMKTDDKI